MPEKLTIVVEARDAARAVFQAVRNRLSGLGRGVTALGRTFTNLRTIIGSAFAVTAIRTFDRLIERGGRAATTMQAFARVTGDAQGALRRMRDATSGLVSNLDLVQQFNRAVALGAASTVSEFQELAQTAVSLGRALGVDAAFALESLSIGIGRQSRLILDNLGLIVSVEQANRRYAQALGVTVDALTDAQKREAFRAAVFESARQKLEELGETQLNAADRWQQLTTAGANFFDTMLRKLAESGPLADFLEGLSTSFEVLAASMREADEQARLLDVFALGQARRGEAPARLRALGGRFNEIVQGLTPAQRRMFSSLAEQGRLTPGAIRGQAQAVAAEFGRGTALPLELADLLEAINRLTAALEIVAEEERQARLAAPEAGAPRFGVRPGLDQLPGRDLAARAAAQFGFPVTAPRTAAELAAAAVSPDRLNAVQKEMAERAEAAGKALKNLTQDAETLARGKQLEAFATAQLITSLGSAANALIQTIRGGGGFLGILGSIVSVAGAVATTLATAGAASPFLAAGLTTGGGLLAALGSRGREPIPVHDAALASIMREEHQRPVRLTVNVLDQFGRRTDQIREAVARREKLDAVSRFGIDD